MGSANNDNATSVQNIPEYLIKLITQYNKITNEENNETFRMCSELIKNSENKQEIIQELTSFYGIGIILLNSD
jgi:hypothetical protein